MKLGRDE